MLMLWKKKAMFLHFLESQFSISSKFMTFPATFQVFLILAVIITRTIAPVSWNFGRQECSAIHNLNYQNYMDKPMTLIDWHSQICWTDNVVPSNSDDVQIICDENCGQTGPIAIQISSNVAINSLRITTSTTNSKYVSLQIRNSATLSILGQFNVTTAPSSWFSLQIFPTSHLLLYDRTFLDASVFNGGSILAPFKRVTILAFYIEMCGNDNSSLINVDVVSIMGAKDSQTFILKRSALLQVTDSAVESSVPALTDARYFMNRGACQDFKLPYYSSYVPGIFFSGNNAKIINATVDVTSFSLNRNSMFIFNHSFQSLVGQNCILKSNSLIVFQNGPRASQSLLLTCELQSSETIHIARSVQFRRETKFFGATKPCSIALVGAFLLQSNSDSINGLVHIQNSLNISSCTVTMLSLKSSFDSRFALIVVNQSSPKTMFLSLTNMVVNRQGLTNNAPLTDILLYSCSDIAHIGKIKFNPATSLAWSCSTSLAAGAWIEFSGNFLKFDGLGQPLVISDPLKNFNVTISHLYEPKVFFQGDAIQVAFNDFILNSGTLSIGISRMNAVHNVSCKLFAQSIGSSVTLTTSAVLVAEDVVFNSFSNIDGILIAKNLTLGQSSNVSGIGEIFIQSDGILSIKKNNALLAPSLTANINSTIPEALQILGALYCHSCNIHNATGSASYLSSFTAIFLYNLNLSSAITLIAPRIFLHNFILKNDITTIIGQLTICSGQSSLSHLNFTNQFRIDEESFLEVSSPLIIPCFGTFNVSGHFHGHVVNADGDFVIGRNSSSHIDELELHSSANLFVSGILTLYSFSANCQAFNCNISGIGSLFLTHFEVNVLSTVTIDLSLVTCLGTFLQHHQSTIRTFNTILDLSLSNTSIFGIFVAKNATLWLSEFSNIVLKNSSMSLFSSFLRVLGHFTHLNSVISMDAASSMFFGEQSNYFIDNSTFLAKQVNFSGKKFMCTNSIISSDVTMLNDVSISHCLIIGNAIVEIGCVVSFPNEANWGMNVTGSTTFLGYIRTRLHFSTRIGHSICILTSNNSLDANIPIIVDGIPKERVHVELKAKCITLTHKGCPPGEEPFNVSDCIKCHIGYYCSEYNSKCKRCPEGMYASIGESSCHFCSRGSFFRGYSSLPPTCTDCQPGMFCNSTGLSRPSGSCDAGTYNPVYGATSRDACRPCPVGQFQNLNGQGTCSYCPAGSYSHINGSVQCFLCPAGKYCLDGCFNSEGDGTCPPGSYSTLGTGKSDSCTSCPAGTYSKYAGTTSLKSCLMCPEGAFCLERCNSSVGSGFCSAGSYSTTGSGENASCSPCPKDRICLPGCGSNVGSVLCDQCRSGSFFDISQKICRLCLPGTFKNANTSSITCDVCSPGSFAQDFGSHECSECPSGYTSTVGSASCVPCSVERLALLPSSNKTICSICTRPNVLFDGLCIDPFQTRSSLFGTNVSLNFPLLNVSVLNETFITRHVYIKILHIKCELIEVLQVL